VRKRTVLAWPNEKKLTIGTNTIYDVQSFTFLRGTTENCKNILNYCFKNVSFALLNGWNVTETNFDHP
jgi:hypothetical protein